MKIKWKPLIICIAIPLAVGILSAALTMNAMKQFMALNQPPASPPSWLFPIVWTVLFVLMGIASYLVYTSNADHEDKKCAFWLYGIQLVLNFLWSIIFFNMKAYTLAFIWLLILLAFVIANTVCFSKLRKSAGYLLIPYIIWTVYAGYLNLMISILN